MTVLRADLHACFDRTSWTDDAPVWPFIAIYTCRRCGAELAFSKWDFDVRALRRLSNLEPAVAQLLEDHTGHSELAGMPFLDWTCRGCDSSVRVYGRQWAGGRHGDAGFELLALLEVEM